MKRSRTGVPVGMITVGRWNRSTRSCQLCRSRKLRCDRSQPCSNCSSREASCQYTAPSVSPPPGGRIIHAADDDTAAIIRNQALAGRPEILATLPESDVKDMLKRVRRLEQAVFDKAEGPDLASRNDAIASVRDIHSSDASVVAVTESPSATFQSSFWTPFCSRSLCSRSLTVPLHNHYPEGERMSKYLPPKDQAAQLLNHFAKSMQPTFGVLHIPSTRGLIEQTYADIMLGKESNYDFVLLLLAICAGCALTWTPDLLERLNVTPTDAKVAFRSYCDLFTTLLNTLSPPLAPSTLALEALLLLIHLLSNTDGRLDQLYTLQARALWMTRVLHLHRLDTTKSREKRMVESSDQIETEVQRRIWWYMVSSDWLLAFSGGPLEGTYVYHPAQMKVDYPLNADDEDITAADELCNLPLSVPTSTSHFIYRIRLAELCREAVDTLPSNAAEIQDPNYDAVLALHAKFQNLIQELPIYFRLDATSIQHSQAICRDRPYIAWQRALLHFSFNTRLCRLHRLFHLKGLTDPKYSFSRLTCSRSAQTVLELRRSLDYTGSSAGLRPALYCLVMQHMFMAAVILATDVSFDPGSPQAYTRKEEVLAACDMLEVSKKESVTAREYIESNIRTLRSLLKNTSKTRSNRIWTKTSTTAMRPQFSTAMPATDPTILAPPRDLSHLNAYESGLMAGGSSAMLGFSQRMHPLGPDRVTPPVLEVGMDFHQGGTGSTGLMAVDSDCTGWDQIWNDFFDVAPELDMPQWNILFDGMDSGSGPINQ